jgi:iron complex transport system ATP-binding protein
MSPDNPARNPPAIQFTHASAFRDGVEILKDFTLSIREGEHLCILGPNGSGKSTIVRLIEGDLHARYQEPSPLLLFGEENWKLYELRKRLGVVSDRLQMRHSRGELVADILLSAFFGSIGLPLYVDITEEMLSRVVETADFLGISRLLERSAATLSSGELRRVLVGRALVHEPGMLLLDEPFTSLDIAARRSFSQLLGKLAASGKALVLVTHELAEIPAAIERIVCIKDGRLFADGPKDELLRSELLSELYGIPLKVERRGEVYDFSAQRDSPVQAG